jgi:hypothetical protein
MSVNETDPLVPKNTEPTAADFVLQAQENTPAPAQLSPDAILGRLSAEKRSFPIFSGIVGALIGSIPGIICWVILGQVGFIAGICGWLMIRGAIFGYSKLADGIDRRGEIISTIVALLMPIVSEYLGLAVSIYRTFHDSYGVTVAEAISTVPLYLAEPDVIQGMIFSLIIGYVLIAFGFIRINPKQQKAAQGQIPQL